jgi:hypothetical protein
MLLEIRTAETENVRKIVIPKKLMHHQSCNLLFSYTFKYLRNYSERIEKQSAAQMQEESKC